MTDIILTTTNVVNDEDIELIGLKVIVRDEEWFGFYDRLQLFRSTQGAGGPYEELTAEGWEVPRLPKGGGDEPASPVTGALVTIVGKMLSLVVNKMPVDIIFTGSDPLTYTQVATQITAQGVTRVRSYVDASGDLVIEGTYPGLISSLSILESDAATILGLPTTEPDSVASGRDARLSLVPLQTAYVLLDYNSKRTYFYKTRFIHTLTGAQSESSAAFSADAAIGVESADIIVGFVTLLDTAGKCLVGAEVHVFNEYTGTLLPSGDPTKIITGGTRIGTTNEAGFVEFPLVRGQKVTVSLQGTSVVRTITVPTDPSIQSFNLLDPNISDPDVFKALVPNIITAERRSL